MNTSTIQKLKHYFEKEPKVVLAFLFGSQAKGRERGISDWDIAVYFQPKEFGEIEVEEEYPNENRIWSDLTRILQSEVDFLVLNRAKPSLVFSVLNAGSPLVVKDRKLYLTLLSKSHYEAVDFWNFIYDFWKIRERSLSLSAEDRGIILEQLIFLENEYEDIGKFRTLHWEEYVKDADIRRNVERWIENLVMVSLDIAKILLASGKKDVPHTYKDTLKRMGILYFDEYFAEHFAPFADLRNIIAHEYLDIRWNRIQHFIQEAQDLYPKFIARIKELVKA